MKEKSFFNSEKEFYNSFIKQFIYPEMADSSCDIIDKPTHYPCIVIRSCGKYFFIYLEDFSKK